MTKSKDDLMKRTNHTEQLYFTCLRVQKWIEKSGAEKKNLVKEHPSCAGSDLLMVSCCKNSALSRSERNPLQQTVHSHR